MPVICKPIESPDDIHENDILVMVDAKGNISTSTAQKIKTSKSDGVEVIYDLRNNKFFNLGMYLEGKSYVKQLYTLIST